MKKIIILFLFFAIKVQAQVIVPFTSERWQFQASKVEFIEHKGIKAMKILPNAGQVILKDFNFSNGTIEFDVEWIDLPFVGIHFRRKDEKESEFVYLRVARTANLTANDAVQYAPIISGINLWDMLGHFQGAANIKSKEWNHVKLVVAGAQMRVYINETLMPTLEIPRLEGNTSEGGISFEGSAIFANLVIKPNQTEKLSEKEGTDLTNHDPYYIRKWAVCQPIVLPKGRELFEEDLPKSETVWETINSERHGLVNLTRKFGKNESRRYVWLKVKIRSAMEQNKQMSLGFSDEVWVVVNGLMTYVDKNLYRQNMRKVPDGRISIENSSFSIPLKAGENELLIGIANDFFGWGIVARLENMEGIEIVKE